jgi:hypothetical protein
MKKRLLAMTAAAILTSGLATAVSSNPALAADHFRINWASYPQFGTAYVDCTHGQGTPEHVGNVIGFTNNCDVRVWAYDRNGNGQCVNPNSSASSQFSEIGRVYVSTVSANC